MFAFDLAKELRCPNVDAMLAQIPLPLFYEWAEYANRKPFGEERADLRAGFIASEVANSQHFKHPRAMRPIDFMPFSDGHKKQGPQTPKQMFVVLKGMAELHKRKTREIEAQKAAKTP